MAESQRSCTELPGSAVVEMLVASDGTGWVLPVVFSRANHPFEEVHEVLAFLLSAAFTNFRDGIRQDSTYRSDMSSTYGETVTQARRNLKGRTERTGHLLPDNRAPHVIFRQRTSEPTMAVNHSAQLLSGPGPSVRVPRTQRDSSNSLDYVCSA